jgi:VIT1/CCC1 family predicted Fe2+/Mn2+ transporter
MNESKLKPTNTARLIERHRGIHTGWLRAAVLGANDGILSTSSLVLGVAAAHGGRSSVLLAGVAGLVSGAMSMAAGEYISVHSQADTEKADLNLERAELKADDKGEHAELSAIYIGRGLDPALAKQVATQLMAHDALGAHARDELGISEPMKPRPIQAAFASACSFSIGAALPLLVAILAPQFQSALAAIARLTAGAGMAVPASFATAEGSFMIAVSGASLLFLALLGALAAREGGAAMGPGALRVTFWGALAMGVTTGVGDLFGTIV